MVAKWDTEDGESYVSASCTIIISAWQAAFVKIYRACTFVSCASRLMWLFCGSRRARSCPRVMVAFPVSVATWSGENFMEKEQHANWGIKVCSCNRKKLGMGIRITANCGNIYISLQQPLLPCILVKVRMKFRNIFGCSLLWMYKGWAFPAIAPRHILC